MKNALKLLPPLSRRAIFLLSVLGMIALGVVIASVQIPSMAETRIKTILGDAGFTGAIIDDLDLQSGGLVAKGIKLDSHGFDTIENLRADFSWPSFLFQQKVGAVEINGLSLSRDAKHSRGMLQNAVIHLGKISGHRLTINNAKLDIKTAFGDLRFTGNATINPPDASGVQVIGANITADQYQLGFNSKWQGRINADGNIMLNADFVDGRLHFGPLSITRFNGWAGAEIAGGTLSLQTQFGAGGAMLFNVPLQDVSMTSEINNQGSTLVYRAAMAGRPDVLLSVDMTGAKDGKTFETLLKGNNLGAFLEDVSERIMDNRAVPAGLNINKPFALSSSYQHDRRFEGGPLPFSLSFKAGEESLLSGNYLIYGDEMDIRGSAEGRPNVAQALQQFFQIGGTHVEGRLIRLDGDLSPLFNHTKAPD